MQQTKPIFNTYIAKVLCNKGNKIVDIQPDKFKENAVIFYFEVNDKFNKDLKELSHNNI